MCCIQVSLHLIVFDTLSGNRRNQHAGGVVRSSCPEGGEGHEATRQKGVVQGSFAGPQAASDSQDQSLFEIPRLPPGVLTPMIFDHRDF